MGVRVILGGEEGGKEGKGGSKMCETWIVNPRMRENRLPI